MKKIILTLAGSLLICVAAIQAQNDTTRNEQQRYRTEGMVVVEVMDIPLAVMETLKDSKYKGWNQRAVYLDPETGEYIVEVEASSGATTQHRINKSGIDVTNQSVDLQDQQPPRDPTVPLEDQDEQMDESDTLQHESDSLQYDPDTQDPTVQANKDTLQKGEPENQIQAQYRTDELVIVEVNDIPVALVETLKDPKYTGWERKAVYLDPLSGEYVIEVEKPGEMATQYRFDSNGQDITDRDKTKKSKGDQNRSHHDRKSSSNRQQKNDTQDTAHSKSESNQDQYRAEELVVVERDEIPTAVSEKLEDPKYKGWKDRTVHLDPKTGEYVVEVEKGSVCHEYRFNKSGEETNHHEKKKDKNKY